VIKGIDFEFETVLCSLETEERRGGERTLEGEEHQRE
jgi:hypothetical protein